MKKVTDSIAWTGLRVFLVGVSLARIFIPSFDLFYEEEIMNFLSVFDSNLFVWIAYVWILGEVLKKVNMPKWMPEIPVLLLLASFAICSLFGLSHTTQTGAKAVFITVVEYGLLNGGLVWFVANGCYSISHEFKKKKWDEIKALVSRIVLHIKKAKALRQAKKAAEAKALLEGEGTV